ncbi:MAG: hypothetical protein ACFFDW_10120, partial [Candidatus Thorarchaeota archaeon]
CKIFTFLVLVSLFLFYPFLTFYSFSYPQNMIIASNPFQSVVDFTDFNVKIEKLDINYNISSQEITIFHNDTYTTSTKEKFIIEYNLGHENFSDFDITMNIGYDISKPPFWGELYLYLGADYDPDVVVPVDNKLCFTCIRDPWGGADGVLVVGAFPIIYGDEYEFVPADLITPNTLTFHINRTAGVVCCEILQNSVSILAHTWDDDLTLLCNYIQICLDYWSEVEEFSFVLSELNARLDITENTENAENPGFTFSISMIDTFSFIVSVISFTIISFIIKNKKIKSNE